ncbi:FkbM family methyltransferase [Sphingomonas sp. MG17]|uniref:FkbM family methyltransferase n=1 Tax=Sphingomonas tagetis TaxID=2949092 RepID=A0A9X2KLW0_9SPHN|nr:FkbM family methyltransferase [Sphingomonas tagetis]MCP3730811.1 FkbM family methyltransferase [Sphingomonas tagetis]
MNYLAKMLAVATRCYPLLSGTGTLANSKLLSLFTPSVGNVWARVGSGSVFVPLQDWVGRSIFWFGDVDPKVTYLARHFLRKGDCALDIGANLGVVAVRMAQMVGSSGRVHAFEPSPMAVKYLTETLSRNPELKISLHQYALGAVESSLRLSVPHGNSGMASFVWQFDQGSAETVEVSVKKLDNIIENIGIKKLSFVKIDVEGFEGEVLRGAISMLRHVRPACIVFEENQKKEGTPESIKILLENGYRVFGICKSWFRLKLIEFDDSKHLKEFDYMAVHEDEVGSIAHLIR